MGKGHLVIHFESIYLNIKAMKKQKMSFFNISSLIVSCKDFPEEEMTCQDIIEG